MIILTSCNNDSNNPLNRKYTDKNIEQDAKDISESKILNDEDISLLFMYLAFSKLGNNDIQGKTYAEILQDAKESKSKLDKEKKLEQEQLENGISNEE